MSVQVMAWVLDHAPHDLAPSEMLVALVLANHTTRDGGHAYPKIETLARETHLSERGVQLALRGLEKRGIIEIEKPATNKLPAMYGFPIFRGANSSPQEDRGAMSSPQGCNEFTSGGAVSAPNPLVEPLVEPSLPPVVPQTKKTPMTEGWQPSESSLAYAIEWGVPSELVAEVVEDFRVYWLNRPREKRPGWDLTFKNRVRDVADQYRRRSRASPNGSNGLKPEERRPAIPVFEGVERKQMSPEKLAQVRREVEARRAT